MKPEKWKTREKQLWIQSNLIFFLTPGNNLGYTQVFSLYLKKTKPENEKRKIIENEKKSL